MAYVKQSWENYPSTATPINATRLAYMEDGIFNAHELMGNFEVGPYVIPYTDTELLRIQHKSTEFTVVEIAAPYGPSGQREATIALMRTVDPESGGSEFLDLYNNGYEYSHQFGIRIQKRGPGVLRPFVLDFYDGATYTRAFEVAPSGHTTFSGYVGIGVEPEVNLHVDGGAYDANVRVSGQGAVLNISTYTDVVEVLSTTSDVWFGTIAAGMSTGIYAGGSVWLRIGEDGAVTVPIAGSLRASKPYVAKSANYTVVATDEIINTSASGGGVTITLLTAVGCAGRQFIIRKSDSSANAVIVATTSSQTINGVTTQSLTAQYESITVVSDGANWMVV